MSCSQEVMASESFQFMSNNLRTTDTMTTGRNHKDPVRHVTGFKPQLTSSKEPRKHFKQHK